MKKILLLLVCLPMFVVGQFTFVPDDNFEQELINLGLDMVFDDYVETASIDTVTSLYVISRGIADLTGIEDFDSLIYLYCGGNQLVNLNLSSNPLLYEVNCSVNQLVSLDLRNGNNQNLFYFTAMNNPSLSCINVGDTVWANNNWAKDSWTNFRTDCNATGIDNYSKQRKLIKVLDIFGRSVTPKPNMTLFYIYNDGTTEKKLIIK